MTDHQHAADGTPGQGAASAVPAGAGVTADTRDAADTRVPSYAGAPAGAGVPAGVGAGAGAEVGSGGAGSGAGASGAADSSGAGSSGSGASGAGMPGVGGAAETEASGGPGGAGAPGGGDRGPGDGSGGGSGRSGDAGDAGGADGVGGNGGIGGSGGSGDAATVTDPFLRDRRYKLIAGVCSGLGRRYDMDPVIFRISLAVLAAAGGLGLVFYGLVWLFVPAEGEEENAVHKLFTGRVDGQALAAVLFALVGCGIFLSMLQSGGVITFAVVLALILAGAAYWSRHRNAGAGDPLAAQAAAEAPPEPQAPPVAITYPSWWREPIVKDGTHVGGTGYLWGPSDSAVERDVRAAIAISQGDYGDRRVPPHGPGPEPARPRGPRWIGGWTFLLALIACGAGIRLTWHHEPLGTSLQIGLAAALIVLGLGIAVSSFLGRTGAGSVFLAVVTAGLLAGASALPKDIGTRWSEETWRPAAVTDVRPVYHLGTGVGTLDLSKLDLDGGETLTSTAEVGLGKLRVVVPHDATVRVTIHVGLGDIQLPGDDQEDVDIAPAQGEERTLEPPAGTKPGGSLNLDLRVAVGQAEVSRAAS